jgi:hypothetical protein
MLRESTALGLPLRVMHCRALGFLAMFELHQFKMIVPARTSLESNARLSRYKFKMVANVQNRNHALLSFYFSYYTVWKQILLVDY